MWRSRQPTPLETSINFARREHDAHKTNSYPPIAVVRALFARTVHVAPAFRLDVGDPEHVPRLSFIALALLRIPSKDRSLLAAHLNKDTVATLMDYYRSCRHGAFRQVFLCELAIYPAIRQILTSIEYQPLDEACTAAEPVAGPDDMGRAWMAWAETVLQARTVTGALNVCWAKPSTTASSYL